MLTPQVSVFGHAAQIPGDLGGKVNTLGGDRIGHSAKKKVHMNVSNSKWLPR